LSYPQQSLLTDTQPCHRPHAPTGQAGNPTFRTDTKSLLTLLPSTPPVLLSLPFLPNMTSTSRPQDRPGKSLEQPILNSTSSSASQDGSGRQPTSSATAAAELARIKISLYGALRRFPDFPTPGINFIDIMPLFLDPTIHAALLRSLELQVLQFCGEGEKPDVIVGLDARGFLFGPSLALRLDCAFVPVRKKGKLPGPCVLAGYEKEYGSDIFQMQEDAIKPGQKVLIVDDIIATGKACRHRSRALRASHADICHLGPQVDPLPRLASLSISSEAISWATSSFSKYLSLRAGRSWEASP